MGIRDRVKVNRTLVQACCERTSFLSTPTQHTLGCRFVNITVDEDFTTSEGIQLAIDGLKGPRDALWFAPPCTGESSWQRLNIVRHPHLIPKLEADRDLFKRLFKSFKKVVAHALSVGAQVYMALPRYCGYWKYPPVQKFLKRHSFQSFIFDWCGYNLNTPSGIPLKQAWSLFFLKPVLHPGL